jgi:hypothetical protein
MALEATKCESLSEVAPGTGAKPFNANKNNAAVHLLISFPRWIAIHTGALNRNRAPLPQKTNCHCDHKQSPVIWEGAESGRKWQIQPTVASANHEGKS